MIHARHYTLEEAAELAPARGRELIERMRAARDRLGDREAREALSEAEPDQRRRRRRAAPCPRASSSCATRMIELRELDVVLRDLDRGLLDFPSLRDGREVYLCWQEGEDDDRLLARARCRLRGHGARSTMAELARAACSGAVRLLNFEQRVAAVAALLLIVSTFGPFSFVEAGRAAARRAACSRCCWRAPRASASTCRSATAR